MCVSKVAANPLDTISEKDHETQLRQMSDPFDSLPRAVYKSQGYESPPQYANRQMYYPQIPTKFVSDAKEAASKIVNTLYPNMEYNVKMNMISTFIQDELARFVIYHKAEMQVMDQMKNARAQSPHVYHNISRTSSSMSNNVTATAVSPQLSLTTNAEQEAVKSLLNMW